MTKKRPIEPVRKQRTHFYRSGESSERLSDFYMHMFSEDVALNVMPIGGRSSRQGFKVQLSPSDSRAEEIIVTGLNRRHAGDSLAHALYDLFRMVGGSLCVADRIVFEIVYLENPQTGKPVGFELAFVNAKQIIEKEGQVYQVISPEVASNEKLPELIPLVREDLIVFHPPNEFRAL